jgi:hypothetical protein
VGSRVEEDDGTMRRGRMPTRWWLVVAAMAGGLGVAAGAAAAGAEGGSAREVADRVLACTVGIRCRTAPWCVGRVGG